MECRTFGTGGTHLTIQAAYQYLQSIMPLTNDYGFAQVGNCTEIGWPGWPNLNLNGHYVKFFCPFESGHQGDPTKGYKITVNGPSLAFRGEGPISSQFIFDGLYFDKIDNINQNLLELGSWWAASTTNVQTYILRNIIFKSTNPTAAGGRAIKPTSTQYNAFKFFNLKFKLFNQAICSQIGGGIAADHIIENVTIDECGEGISWSGIGQAWDIRNSVCVNCLTNGWGALGGGGNNNLYNCADDDNSMAASGANLINCKPNIIPADEFQSTDITNSDWLKLKEGNASLDGGASPTKGKYPLKVGFNANVLFQDYAPNLGKNGAAPSISDNDTDIAGKPRPGYDDAYSIGAHEQQYSNFPET